MFEQFDAEERGQKEERNKLLRITAIIVCIVAIAGGIIYIATRGHAKSSPPPAAPAAPAAQAHAGPPDPVHDLHIVNLAMGKDPSGLRVLWSVEVRNRSTVYTYSDIEYDAYFLSVDGKRLGEDKDTIKDSIGPGEEKKFPPILDGIYDSHYSTYQFLIVSAKSAVKQ